jgi:D-3-phosphoglycerate dehydrogenase
MALTLILAATHNVVAKDSLTRSGRWKDKMDYMGFGVTGRLVGIIGLGNIGREFVNVTRPLDMKYQAYDPYVTSDVAESLGVSLVDLPTLMATSDIVCVIAPLTPETKHMIGAQELALMKQSAYLINVARGAIVDQGALTKALSEHRIRGAGLDVFETEPPDPHDPLFSLENVVVAPHALCWTDELALGMGHSALRAVIDVAQGHRPAHIVNPEVVVAGIS